MRITRVRPRPIDKSCSRPVGFYHRRSFVICPGCELLDNGCGGLRVARIVVGGRAHDRGELVDRSEWVLRRGEAVIFKDAQEGGLICALVPSDPNYGGASPIGEIRG